MVGLGSQCNWLGSGWCLTGNKKPPKAPNGSSQGIQAQRIELEGEIGTGERLMPWFKALARRLSRVVVLNQDWKAALTPTVLQESRKKDGLVGIFLDGTLDQTGDQTQGKTAEETWEWARWIGEKYRIAYACQEGKIEPPQGMEGNGNGVREHQPTVPPGRPGYGHLLPTLHRAAAIPIRAGLLNRKTARKKKEESQWILKPGKNRKS